MTTDTDYTTDTAGELTGPAADMPTACGRVETALLHKALMWTVPSAADRTSPSLSVVSFTVSTVDNAPQHYGRDWSTAVTESDSGYVLTVAATDRYRLTYATVPILDIGTLNPDPYAICEGSVLVDVADIKQHVTAFGKAGMSATTTLTQTGGMVTFATKQTGGDSAVTLLERVGSFPNVRQLMGTIKPAELAAGPVAYDPQFLGDMATAARKIDRGSQLQLAPNGERATVVRLNRDSVMRFAGLVMPVRIR